MIDDLDTFSSSIQQQSLRLSDERQKSNMIFEYIELKNTSVETGQK